MRFRSAAEERQIFQEKLRLTLGEGGTVQDLTQGQTLEILDLDCVTNADDVKDALKKETGQDVDFKVHIFGPNKSDICMAVCEVDRNTAQRLLKKARIKIGWVNC